MGVSGDYLARGGETVQIGAGVEVTVRVDRRSWVGVESTAGSIAETEVEIRVKVEVDVETSADGPRAITEWQTSVSQLGGSHICVYFRQQDRQIGFQLQCECMGLSMSVSKEMADLTVCMITLGGYRTTLRSM